MLSSIASESIACDWMLLSVEAVRARDPALPVAQSAHEIRLLIETSGPCSNAEQEIVSRSFNLEEFRPHGTAPMTTTQLA